MRQRQKNTLAHPSLLPLSAGDIGRKGEMLYFIAWNGYSAEASTWEPARNVGKGAIADYLEGLRQEAEADGAEEAELEEDEDDDTTMEEVAEGE